MGVKAEWTEQEFEEREAEFDPPIEWCDVCQAPQYVLPNGEHLCGEQTQCDCCGEWVLLGEISSGEVWSDRTEVSACRACRR